MGIPDISRDGLQTMSSTCSSLDRRDTEDSFAKKEIEYRITERVTLSHAFHVRAVSSRRISFHLIGEPVLHRDASPSNARRLCHHGTQSELISLSRRRGGGDVGTELVLRDHRTDAVYTIRKKGLMPGNGRGTLLVTSVAADEIDRDHNDDRDAARSDARGVKPVKKKSNVSNARKVGKINPPQRVATNDLAKQAAAKKNKKSKKDVVSPSFSVTTDLWRTGAVVTDVQSQRKLAVISRPRSVSKKVIMGLDSYHIKIFPGSDIPLMLMLAVSFDEHYAEPAQ